jgi:pimeloyl-ACP methyl ester carboxylesterase
VVAQNVFREDVFAVSERFEWEGRRIAYAVAGHGPAVVMNHGWPFSSRVWARYAAALAEEFTVHLWDMPGYGASSRRAADGVSFADQSRAFEALLDHWGLDEPHVVAHDFGGAVALRTAVVSKRRYASLLLVDPVAIPPIGSPFFRYVAEHDGLFDELPSFVHDAAVESYIAGATVSPLSMAERGALVAPWRGPAGQAAFYRQIAQFDEQLLAENEAHLGELTCPTKLLWAEDDEWIPLEYGRRLAGLLPSAEFSTIAHAGHLVQYDAPVALTKHVNDWLRRSIAPNTAP